MRPASRTAGRWLMMAALMLWVMLLVGPLPPDPAEAQPHFQTDLTPTSTPAPTLVLTPTVTATPSPTSPPLPAMSGDPISCPDGSARSWSRFAGGPQPGRFADARGIVIDRDGNLMIADSGNGRLQRLSPRGEVLGIIDLPPENPYTKPSPAGLAIDDAGNLYIADSASRRVMKLTADGGATTIWRSSFPPERTDVIINQVAVGAGFLYVAEFAYGNRTLTQPRISQIIRISLATGASSTITVPTPKLPSGPLRGLAADADGYIYAAEYSQYGGILQKFASNGDLVAVWEQAGEYKFARLAWLTVGLDGNLYISDQDGWWIRAVTRDGVFLGSWQGSQGAGLAVDKDGMIYVAGGGGRSGDERPIGRLAPAGERLASIGAPFDTPGVLEGIRDIRLDPAGHVHALSRNIVHEYGPDGVLLGARSETQLPAQSVYGAGRWSFADDGGFYTLSREQQLRRVSSSGEILGIWQAISDGRGVVQPSEGTFLVAPDGTAYISDSYSIYKIGPDGQQVARWLPEDIDRWAPRGRGFKPSALALDGDGNLYIGGGAYIYKVAQDGSVLARWGASPVDVGQETAANVYAGVRSIAVDAAGYVHISAGERSSIRMLGPDGALLAVWAHQPRGQRLTVGEFPGGGLLTVDRRGNAYAATNTEIWRLGCAGS